MSELFLAAWMLVSVGFERPLYTPELGLGDDEVFRVDELDQCAAPIPLGRGVTETAIHSSAGAAASGDRRLLRAAVAKCFAAARKRDPDDPDLVVGTLRYFVVSNSFGRVEHVGVLGGAHPYALRGCIRTSVGSLRLSGSMTLTHEVRFEEP